MNRNMLSAIFCAIAALCSISTARGTILVYEGFHQGDWTGITATGSQQIHKATTTGKYSTGFTVGSKWSMADSTTQISVSGTDYGLSLPAVMTAKGFTTCGGAAQCNPGSDNNELRGGRHDFSSNTLKVSSGTLYVRALLRLTAPAAAKLNSVATPASNANGSYFGFGLIGSTSSSKYAPTTTSNKSSCSFLMWKNSDGTLILSLCLIDAAGTLSHYPLVTGVTLDSTYLCYAEIGVGASTDGAELVRAGAVDTADFTGAVSWAALDGASDTVEVQLITDSAYPKSMAFTGPYGTNGGSFRADELVVGTEMKDILPVGGVFSVSGTGSPTVTTNSFSTAWLLVADEGVTADAGLVWSMGEAFTTATTNLLGTGLSADTRTAALTGLEPAMTYWWKIYADNGTEVAETTPASFTTPGAPVFGTTTATMTGESAAFSVALEEAALENTLSTFVSVFYGTDGENWTELPLGSASAAETFSGSANNLGYGVTYQWFARASATMEGGRVLSTDSVTNSFTTLYNGDMYVDAATENATPPYSSTATAAANIPEALAIATDGATIHVAEGLYKISNPLNVTSAVRILGNDPDPSRVVVSNTVKANYKIGNRRVFILNHANAFVANLTMTKGSAWGDWTAGGNLYIGANGGTVSNCVLDAGILVSGHASGGGAALVAGLLTHSVVRGSISEAGSTQWGQNKALALWLEGTGRAENCLIAHHHPSTALVIAKLDDTAIMRNCSIVDGSLTATSEWCTVRSPLVIGANATVQNVVVAGITNTVDNIPCLPTGTRSNFVNGAVEGDITGTSFPEGTVTGTASSFFKDYANGDYTLNPTSLLVNAGANYEGMASVDLAKKRRKVGPRIDIGCYELQSNGLTMVIR